MSAVAIIRSRDRSFVDSVPVIVVGAGACGLTAALAAAERGVDVVVLERDKRPWGSTGMSIGAVCAVDSAEQRAQGVTDSVDAFVADEGPANMAAAQIFLDAVGGAVGVVGKRAALGIGLEFGAGHRLGEDRGGERGRQGGDEKNAVHNVQSLPELHGSG